MKSQIYKSRFLLILAGVCLGYAARAILGVPSAENEQSNQFVRPLPADTTIEFDADDFDLPLERDEEPNEQGLVPPLRLPGQRPYRSVSSSTRLFPQADWPARIQFAGDAHTPFEHDDRAEFEPHGEMICASGCAASRHPTAQLSLSQFEELLVQFCEQPLAQTSPALETLLYYGPQSRYLIESHGFGALDEKRVELLWDQLKLTHARVSIRVVDERGEICTWLPPTSVPFDRRHVFEMKTKGLQALVTSGTVKRVGLHHLWVRL